MTKTLSATAPRTGAFDNLLRGHESPNGRIANRSRTLIGGSIDADCQLTARFRLIDRPEIRGVAHIDTGFANCMVTPEFAERAGLVVRPTKFELEGIGGVVVPLDEAYMEYEVEALEGPALRLSGMLGVASMPQGVDMIIGADLLFKGDFVIDGPGRRWAWVVDHSGAGFRNRRASPNEKWRASG